MEELVQLDCQNTCEDVRGTGDSPTICLQNFVFMIRIQEGHCQMDPAHADSGTESMLLSM